VVAEILGLDNIFLSYYASAVVIIIILALCSVADSATDQFRGHIH